MYQHVMTISGAFETEACLCFIQSYLRRLNLDSQITRAGDDAITLMLRGQPELIQMLEMACWLGPQDSRIERVEVMRC